MAREVNMAALFASAHVRLTTPQQTRVCGFHPYVQVQHRQTLQQWMTRGVIGRVLAGEAQ
jgi:hypothetical protein